MGPILVLKEPDCINLSLTVSIEVSKFLKFSKTSEKCFLSTRHKNWKLLLIKWVFCRVTNFITVYLPEKMALKVAWENYLVDPKLIRREFLADKTSAVVATNNTNPSSQVTFLWVFGFESVVCWRGNDNEIGTQHWFSLSLIGIRVQILIKSCVFPDCINF